MYVRTRRSKAASRRAALGDIPLGLTTFPAGVEAWRDLVASQAGISLPVNFLLAWIYAESGSNPCSATSLGEWGIFQLMAPDNIAQGGTTVALQHPVPPCVAGIQTTAGFSSLTSDQQNEQVRAGIQYVNYCVSYAETQMTAFGYIGQPGWTNSDWSYWAMVKMVHVAPAVIPGMLQAGLNGAGGVPVDWNDLVQYVTSVPANWLANASEVGSYGAGGPSITNLVNNGTFVAALAGLALVYWWTSR